MSKIRIGIAILFVLLASSSLYLHSKLKDTKVKLKAQIEYSNKLKFQIDFLSAENSKLKAFKDSVASFSLPYEKEYIAPPRPIENLEDPYKDLLNF